jgi:RNA polymerase sigma-70 factor (ECF subfamily)
MQYFSNLQGITYVTVTKKRGDWLEFNDAVEKYSNMVFRLAYSMTKNKQDSEDVYQDVFMRYLRSGTRFENEEHRKAWLIRATVNRSKSLLASAWFRNTTALDIEPAAPENDGDCVYWAVMELPKKYRTAIHLYYYEDMPIDEIAKITGDKPSTIASRLHRARAMLKEKLKGEEF